MDYHLPILFCVDTSNSMNDLSENGKSKIQIVEEKINCLANCVFEHSENIAVDICIITFNNKVETILDWIPLSKFHGGVGFKTEGDTALCTAVINAIDKTRERRRCYLNLGVLAMRPKICLFTDGISTESLDAAFRRSQEYLNRDNPSAKIYITLVPPAVDETELKSFGDMVTISRINDFVTSDLLSYCLREDPPLPYHDPFSHVPEIRIPIPESLADNDVDEFAWDDVWGDSEESDGFKWDDEEKFDDLENCGNVNTYGEIVSPKNPMGVHIPVVICIDTSSSMNDVAEDGRSKKQILEETINEIVNLQLTDYNKQCIDICILVFDDEVRTLVEWRPLSDFNGDIKLDVAGTTALSSAVVKAIEKSKERHRTYCMLGIQSTRPFIFVFTDGYSTESLDDIYKDCHDYFDNRLKAKMFVTLIPPLRDCCELKALGDKVTIFRVNDCANGIKSIYDFIQECIIYHFCARQSDNTFILIPDNLDVLNRNGKDDIIMENGQKYFKMIN